MSRQLGRPRHATTRPATIRDVAAAVGVSRQTVTRAMNGMTGISEQTRTRVLKTAREMHYRPSRFGRGLAKRDHHAIGLVINDLTNPYYAELASAVARFASLAGWNVVLADTAHTPDLPNLLENLTSQVDVVLGYIHLTDEQSESILAGLPVVQIDPPSVPNGEPASAVAQWRGSIELDYAQAMADASDHLIAHGSTHPAILDSCAPGMMTLRAQEFVAAMESRGISVPVVDAIEETMEAAVAATSELLRDYPQTDAILAFNDLLAFGVLKSLRLAGVDVPGQIRVIGIDGLSIGTFVTPQLSTLALDMTEVAKVAVDTAIAMSTGELPRSGPEVCKQVAHHLVIRESS